MKQANTLAAMSLALMAVLPSEGSASKPTPAAAPNADRILQEMSDKLAGTRNFSVKAHRVMDPALVVSGAISNARIEAAIVRPNRVAVHSAGGGDSRRFIFDGRTFSLIDEKKNLFARVPMRTDIDGLVDKLDEVYGVTLPLAEFILSNPYKDLRRQAGAISYLGRGSVGGFMGIGGVACHRLALTGKLADAELWVGVDNHLPYKLVARFKKHPEQPELRAEFSSWNLDARTPAAAFSFRPAKEAAQIEMIRQKKN